MEENFRPRILKTITVFLFVVTVFWWLKILLIGASDIEKNYFGLFYPLIAIMGGLNGIFASRLWGATKSSTGKSLIYISMGLLGLAMGEYIWSFYDLILNIEVPYPSLADLGYFSVVPLYSLGSISMGVATGAKYGWRDKKDRLMILVTCSLTFIFTLLLFADNFYFDSQNLPKTFFDFAYPIGESIAICISLSTLYLSRKYIGGLMQGKMLFFLLALVWHFTTEFIFLYQVSRNIYVNGNFVDMMYASSYFLMAYVLSSFSVKFDLT